MKRARRTEYAIGCSILVVAPVLFSLLVGINANIPFTFMGKMVAAAKASADTGEFIGYMIELEPQSWRMWLEMGLLGSVACLISGVVIGRFAGSIHHGYSALVAVLPLAIGIAAYQSPPWIASTVIGWPIAGVLGAWLAARKRRPDEEAEPAPS